MDIPFLKIRVSWNMVPYFYRYATGYWCLTLKTYATSSSEMLISPYLPTYLPSYQSSHPLIHQSSHPSRSGLWNLWHTKPKWHAERIPWHVAFTAVSFFLFPLPDQHLHIVKNMHIYIYIYHYY